MDKLTQEVPQSFRARMYQQDTFRRKEHRILVLKTRIAGLKYHMENEEEQAALDAITPGTELLLYREPENEYDEWAVAVYLTEEHKLGYIFRSKNEVIARLMDAGKKFIGVVDAPADDSADDSVEEEAGVKRRRIIHQPLYDERVLLFSVYMIEEG